MNVIDITVIVIITTTIIIVIIIIKDITKMPFIMKNA